MAISTLPFKSFQKDCCEFLLACNVSTAGFSPEMLSSWNEILVLIRDVANYPEKASVVAARDGFEQIAAATERILSRAPRYVSQTSEMSPKNQLAISKAQITAFIVRLTKANPAFDAQRAVKRDDELAKTMEELWKASSKKYENQAYVMNHNSEVKMRAGVIEGVIERQQKLRLNGQDWVSPKIQKADDMQELGRRIENMEKTKMVNQTYYMTEQKEKDMYMSKVEGSLNRMGSRFDNQRALSKQDVREQKFDEIDRILNNSSPRYESQTAVHPAQKRGRRHSFQAMPTTPMPFRSREELQADGSTGLGDISESGIVNAVIPHRERRKSVQAMVTSMMPTSISRRFSSVHEVEKIEAAPKPAQDSSANAAATSDPNHSQAILDLDKLLKTEPPAAAREIAKKEESLEQKPKDSPQLSIYRKIKRRLSIQRDPVSSAAVEKGKGVAQRKPEEDSVSVQGKHNTGEMTEADAQEIENMMNRVPKRFDGQMAEVSQTSSPLQSSVGSKKQA
ncbi:hypothetical protein HDU91_001472, partial [Kappamyces sp. JEL0680]